MKKRSYATLLTIECASFRDASMHGLKFLISHFSILPITLDDVKADAGGNQIDSRLNP